jgi:hypothetical protein
MAGDTTSTQQALLEQTVDGVSPGNAETHRTLERILGYARINPAFYLPSHDPESMKRLNSSKEVLPPSATVAMNCAI